MLNQPHETIFKLTHYRRGVNHGRLLQAVTTKGGRSDAGDGMLYFCLWGASHNFHIPPFKWEYEYLVSLRDGEILFQKTTIIHENGFCFPSIEVESETTVSLLTVTAPLTLFSTYLLLSNPQKPKSGPTLS